MSRQQVDLSLPKFRLDPPLMSLADSLKSLGMTYAFNIPTGTADFSGIAVRKPDDYLYISDIFHKTFVDVDENGTEAAAATAAVMMRATMAPMDPVTVTVDRPFLFAIQHRPSGTCLFLGRMANPLTP
jgi:serpin B